MKTTTDMAGFRAAGCRAMAERVARAESDFLDTLMSVGDIDRAEAERALACFRRLRLVKMDAVNGRIEVRHGSFMDRDVIRRAAA